jgi:hypothetical protein
MGMIKVMKDRWNSETPKFFKKIRRGSVAVTSTASTVWVTNQSMSLELHETILDICKYVIAISVAIGLTSQLTQVNPPEENL